MEPYQGRPGPPRSLSGPRPQSFQPGQNEKKKSVQRTKAKAKAYQPRKQDRPNPGPPQTLEPRVELGFRFSTEMRFALNASCQRPRLLVGSLGRAGKLCQSCLAFPFDIQMISTRKSRSGRSPSLAPTCLAVHDDPKRRRSVVLHNLAPVAFQGPGTLIEHSARSMDRNLGQPPELEAAVSSPTARESLWTGTQTISHAAQKRCKPKKKIGAENVPGELTAACLDLHGR